jgi:hypothetical protein
MGNTELWHRAPKTKGLIFDTWSVKRILDGRKTETRLLADIQGENVLSPPYVPGDMVYVRETYRCNADGTYSYKAPRIGEGVQEGKWKPSIHMPKEAARLWLRVTLVRLERLQEITEEGAVREGAKDLEDFKVVWDGIYGDSSRGRWAQNPLVWRIIFDVLA